MSGTCRMLSWFGDLKVTALILVHRIFWNISISLESCKRREFRWGWCSFLLHKTMVFITVTKPWLLRGNLPAILVCRVLFHENFATTQKKSHPRARIFSRTFTLEVIQRRLHWLVQNKRGFRCRLAKTSQVRILLTSKPNYVQCNCDHPWL